MSFDTRLLTGVGVLAAVNECKRRSKNPSVKQPSRSVAPE